MSYVALHLMFYLVLVTLICSFQQQRCSAQLQQKLPDSEIKALEVIKAKLNVKTWDLDVNPCGGNPPWVVPTTEFANLNNLTCGDCDSSTNDDGTTLCHVVSILLKSLNLTGFLPEEFAELTHLTELDLTRNYINGTIPKAWGRLPLVSLSLLDNRISGPLPEEIGNISTLQFLILENNLLEGHLPQSLGNLTNLKRLRLSANNFVGKLPASMDNLKNLQQFTIDGSSVSGKIPDFIGKWTILERLDIIGTSLEGPFPRAFADLKNLTDLKVSDMKLKAFPPLEKMDLKYLFLRNCSLSGEIPNYIGLKKNLDILDLSFNNFSGEIPPTFEDLLESKTRYMFLGNNMLTGMIPDWMFGTKRTIDLSYNLFTGPDKGGCSQQVDVNMVSSLSSSTNNSITPCLRKNHPCRGKAKNYQLFINCGGKEVEVDGVKYEADNAVHGEATFVLSGRKNWAYSSTGFYVGNPRPRFKEENTSALNINDPQLYMSARTSASSLHYYGLCLQSGNYTVKLHFAEIIFKDDQTYYGIGRRFFDVFIQGQRALKDFNIAEAANGTGREIVKSFVTYVDNTLDIHLRWSGKGTNAVPDRGTTYGPLISAISVKPRFKPDIDEGREFPVAAKIGIAIVSCLILLLFALTLFVVLRKKEQENKDLKQLKLQGAYFSLKQLKTATRDFDPANKIGEGGFGPVYKGQLAEGTLVAVKQLSSKSKQGNREFVNEIGMISALQHPNLVKLFGCCIEGNQLMLIYEYLENNSLSRALFGHDGTELHLDWQARRRISLDIARGLAFLHEGSALKIVHRDIKATNILLDRDLHAKISDFGLAKLDEEENTHIITRVAGTIGYMAPEYAMRGLLTEKADIYSFGVVILELVSGKSNNTHYRPKDEFICLLDCAYFLNDRGALLELVDPRIGSDYPEGEAEVMLGLALICTSPSPALRPSMSTVIRILEGQEPLPIPAARQDHTLREESRSGAFEKPSCDWNQDQYAPFDGPCTTSPVNKSEDATREETALLSVCLG